MLCNSGKDIFEHTESLWLSPTEPIFLTTEHTFMRSPSGGYTRFITKSK
jgi:hypothetical protein